LKVLLRLRADSPLNQRGASDETRIKELKIDLGMKRMPCG